MHWLEVHARDSIWARNLSLRRQRMSTAWGRRNDKQVKWFVEEEGETQHYQIYGPIDVKTPLSLGWADRQKQSQEEKRQKNKEENRTVLHLPPPTPPPIPSPSLAPLPYPTLQHHAGVRNSN